MPFNLVSSSSLGIPTADPHSTLPLPNGTVGEADDVTLRRQLDRLGIPQSHTRPRSELIRDYDKLLRKVWDDAGSKAVSEFLESHRS
jgi:hypothetical protein